jgi:hypothetical protein
LLAQASRKTSPSDQRQYNEVMTRFESAPLACPSRPKTCLPDRHQINEAKTRFESAPFANPSRPKNLSVGPTSSQRSDDSFRVSTTCLCSSRPQNLSVCPSSSQRSDDSIRVSTFCLPKPADKKTCLSDRPQANEVMTRFESALLACPSRPSNLSLGPASSLRSDDSI